MSTPPRRRIGRRVEPTAEERRRILAEEAKDAKLPKPRPLGAIAAAVTGVLALIGVAIFLAARHAEPLDSFPYPLGIACGIGAAAIYALFVFRLLESLGELWTVFEVLMRTVIVLLAVVAFSGTAIGILTLMNVRLDRSAPEPHRALVLSKPAGGQQPTAGVRVQWRPDVEKVVPVPAELLSQIEPRRSLLIVSVRPGRFGWPWIDGAPSVETPPPPPPPSGADAISEERRAQARALLAEAGTLLRDSPDQAITALKSAIELDPWNIAPYVALDDALSRQDDFRAAAEYWSQFLELAPTHVEARFARARARRAANDPGGAVEDAARACEAGHAIACELARGLQAPAATTPAPAPPPAPIR